MRKEEKYQIVETLVDKLKSSEFIYLTDTSNLDVETINELRRLCFKRKVSLQVVKNTLLRKAMEQTERDFSPLFDVMKGSTSVMLSETGNVPARLIKEFRKNKRSERPYFKGAYIQEDFYVGEDQLEALVGLKSKEELIGDLIGLLQSPITNVLSALQSGGNTIAGVVKTLSEREA